MTLSTCLHTSAGVGMNVISQLSLCGASLQCVIGKGHTVLERERISLCQQHEQIASFSDDEMEMPSNTGEVVPLHRACNSTWNIVSKTLRLHVHIIARPTEVSTCRFFRVLTAGWQRRRRPLRAALVA